ncbi:MAG: type II toxin-antitoxin system Phd/YefM family antitoxin [Candidatus Dormibacteria bacterium]
MNVEEAKTNLSHLIVEVQSGKEVVITRAGRPVAKLVPYDGSDRPRRMPGGWEGRVRMAEDFDKMPLRLVQAFEKPTF